MRDFEFLEILGAMDVQTKNALSRVNAIPDNIRYLDRGQAYPFVKWAGGKRTLVPDILQVVPKTFNTYYEPFLGGGAVFFGLAGRIRNAVLSDLNAELMLTYRMIQTSPDAVIEVLEEHQRKHSKAHYIGTRKEGHCEQDSVKLAARFIYLNKSCYNGLYRVNKSNQFNVPMGAYKNPVICDRKNLLAVSKVLQKAILQIQSFDQITPSAGDLVYCDPPYDETFTQYTDKGFTRSDQESLRKACDVWIRSGAYVIVSSSDTEFIRKTWNGYRIVEVKAAKNISCKGNERTKVSELLIISYGG